MLKLNKVVIGSYFLRESLEEKIDIMKHLHLLLLLVIPSILVCACRKESKENPEEPGPLTDIFQEAGQNSNLRCLLVYKDTAIVKAKYYKGDANTPHDVRSVTKSIMATLTGIAIDKGYIPSEDTKIGSYLRAYGYSVDSAKVNIRIKHVLSMSTGIAGNELTDLSAYFDWFYNAPNQLAYTLNQPMINEPGSTFNYNSGPAHFMSAILTQATGNTSLEFARENLFKPLAVSNCNWEKDKQGLYNGGAGIQLTPIDMLKIGMLYLNKGMYKGTRVVSEAWITKTTSVQIESGNAQPFTNGYGYFLWLGNTNGHNYFLANGYGGQFIVVVPDLKLIVVATNDHYGIPATTANEQWYTTLNIIINKIIPLYY